MRYLKVFQYPKSGCRSKIWQSTRQLLGAADPAFAISIGSARQLLLGAQLLESQVSLNHAGTVDHVAGTRLCPTGLRTSSRVGVKCPDIGFFGKIAYLPTLDLT